MNKINNTINQCVTGFKNSGIHLPAIPRTVTWVVNGTIGLAAALTAAQYYKTPSTDSFKVESEDQQIEIFYFYLLLSILAVRFGMYCYDSFAKWTLKGTPTYTGPEKLSNKSESPKPEKPELKSDETNLNPSNKSETDKSGLIEVVEYRKEGIYVSHIDEATMLSIPKGSKRIIGKEFRQALQGQRNAQAKIKNLVKTEKQ